MKKIIALTLTFSIVIASFARIRLPSVLSSNMVLQQKSTVKLWERCAHAEKIIVRTFGSNKADLVVGTRDANWQINIQTPVAGGPYTITLNGKNQTNTLFVAGDDKIFYPAEAKIENDKLIVCSKNVKPPVTVRYSYRNIAIGNLFSKDGLPVIRFRTDNREVDTSCYAVLKLPVASMSYSKWMGFKRTDFKLQGRNCIVVEPVKSASGKPWIWRTEFFGHEPQGDSTLAAKGFHVVYMDLQDMYGAPVALNLMDNLYEYLTKDKGLNRKVVLEGFSRGGLFAFNWAGRHPDRVSCMYIDAPVCDFKSWPGGKGKSIGSPDDWRKLKKVYGFTSEKQAMEYKFNPIDNLEPIAKAKIPIICVCGETDDVVPMQENINIVEERYKKMGGKIKVIAKPNNGHHPHSLKDPTPIVEFILESTMY